MASTAPRYLDHVVVTTPDLAAAVRDLESATGVAPEPGGVHPTFGTRNYLVTFGGDRYLEILGADPENHGFTGIRPFGVDDVTGTATSTWAIHPPDISGAVTAARAAGIDPGEPYDGSRRTADGTLLQWRLTKDHAEPSGVVPFLLDWGETVSPARTTTPQLGLVELVASHPEPARIRSVLTALGTDLEVSEGPARLRLTVEGPAGSTTL
ncbi:VOC family protein [Georgenia halophila]|uniref:VOC family protein n=1 Tax=Georgenia halophila TaxID=620889 RepID=A0ABP8KTH6_9MICO